MQQHARRAGQHRDIIRSTRIKQNQALVAVDQPAEPHATQPLDPLTTAFASNPAALLILGTLIGVGAVTLLAAPQWIERGMLRPFWLVQRREVVTLLTNAFLHADLSHLLFNAFSLWVFGFGLERSMGTRAFVQLYLVGLVISDLTTFIRHRRDPAYRTLGASGAIMAVLFASIVYTPEQSIYILPIPVPIPAPLFAVGYLAYTWYAARQKTGGVNHDAHFGGALAGLAFVALHDPAVFGSAMRRAGLSG